MAQDLRVFASWKHRVIQRQALLHIACSPGRFNSSKTTRIVFATCSNSAVLRGLFKPNALTIDEAANCKAKDAMIPLSLNPRFLLVAGDNEQLAPMVSNPDRNPESAQDSMSFYDRFYNHHTVPLFRLKENLRMHVDICTFPGMMSYTWLDCHPSTSEERPEFLYFQDWYNKEDNYFANNRRYPNWGANREAESIRRLLICPNGGISGSLPGSTSQVNYANVNVICDLVQDLFSHVPSDGIPDLAGHEVTIMAPYADQVAEIRRQVRWRLRRVNIDFQNFPQVRSSDDMQGDENSIIIACLTPANDYQGYLIGFLRVYNRLNVIQTRAKQVFIMVGDIERWRADLIVLVKGLKCKRLALLIIDLLDLGDVIDYEATHWLPSCEEELDDVESWSLEQPESLADVKANKRYAKLLVDYDNSAKAEFELELLEELHTYRKRAAEFKKLSAEGIDADLPLFNKVEGEGPDGDEEFEDAVYEDAPEDEPAPEDKPDPVDTEMGGTTTEDAMEKVADDLSDISGAATEDEVELEDALESVDEVDPDKAAWLVDQALTGSTDSLEVWKERRSKQNKSGGSSTNAPSSFGPPRLCPRVRRSDIERRRRRLRRKVRRTTSRRVVSLSTPRTSPSR